MREEDAQISLPYVYPHKTCRHYNKYLSGEWNAHIDILSTTILAILFKRQKCDIRAWKVERLCVWISIFRDYTEENIYFYCANTQHATNTYFFGHWRARNSKHHNIWHNCMCLLLEFCLHQKTLPIWHCRKICKLMLGSASLVLHGSLNLHQTQILLKYIEPGHTTQMLLYLCS